MTPRPERPVKQPDDPLKQPDNAPVMTGDRMVAGAVTRREDQRERRTHDERLLARNHVDQLHGDPWRVLRISSEFVEGFETLASLGPAISFFGSARTQPSDPAYLAARELGAELARRGYAVITGGGPGLMEAANRGASEAGGASVGLGIELPHESELNAWVNLGVNFRYFFARKVMFLKYAQGFIVMPGGYGTLDELFEALTLTQTGKVTSFPVVLFGSAYWGGLVGWLHDVMLASGNISPDDLCFLVTDDVDAAVNHVTGQAERVCGDQSRQVGR